MERASEKTEDTFINIPIYTESHNLSILETCTRDKTPAGKRDDIVEGKRRIKKDLNDGIDTVGGKMTVYASFC